MRLPRKRRGSARGGRLAVYGARNPSDTRFVVIPDDGSDPIDLRVNRALVMAKAGEAATATVTCYVAEIAIEDWDRKRFDAKPPHGGPVVWPHVEVVDETGKAIANTAVWWNFEAGNGPSSLYIEEPSLSGGAAS